jgi:hypothetical protein
MVIVNNTADDFALWALHCYNQEVDLDAELVDRIVEENMASLAV